jgi:hypothetical protein
MNMPGIVKNIMASWNWRSYYIEKPETKARPMS